MHKLQTSAWTALPLLKWIQLTSYLLHFINIAFYHKVINGLHGNFVFESEKSFSFAYNFFFITLYTVFHPFNCCNSFQKSHYFQISTFLLKCLQCSLFFFFFFFSHESQCLQIQATSFLFDLMIHICQNAKSLTLLFFIYIYIFQSYILDASRRSSVMQLSSLPISGYSCIILAPIETPAWLWKSQAASLIATCYALASTKAKKFLSCWTSAILMDICLSVIANEKQGISHSSTIYNTIFTSSGFGWLLPDSVLR